MSSRSLLWIAVIAMFHFTYAELTGKPCGPSGCCKDTETCCSGDGCCPATYPHCCSDGRCCPAAYPVCCTAGCCPSGSYCCGQECCTGDSISGRLPRHFKPGEREEPNSMFYYTQATDVHAEARETLAYYREANRMHHFKQAALSGPCNSYEREKLNEGYHTHVYIDPIKHLRTIGVGFNLQKSGAREQIESVGANYDAVFNGSQNLTDSQIISLFNMDMNTAVKCVMGLMPKLSSLGLGPQSAMADMAFNLGCTSLGGFTCLRVALFRSPPDLEWATEEMKDSKWCGQVGARCGRDVACMN